MIEKIRTIIKAWKDRKRLEKETRAAGKLIGQIERALGIEFYEWQRLYIITGIWQPPAGRQQGRTTAYIVRLLIDQSKPLLLYDMPETRAYADDPFTEGQYEAVPTQYAQWFKRELIDIYAKLLDAGVHTRAVAWSRGQIIIERW